MSTPARTQFQAALTAAYASLFASDPAYAYSASKTTPEAMAAKMMAATLAGSASVTGPGFRMACKACGIPHTAKAIDAFLGIAAPVKAPKPAKAHKSYMLSASNIEAAMSGAIAAFASGDSVVLKYSDGSSERAELPEQAAEIRAYAKDTRGTAPNFFAIVSAVQSKRQAVTS
jgi:hypothetical protein